ncbi:MAG: hypothetical protein R2699_04135 [Acidimicrobiales bacterium]
MTSQNSRRDWAPRRSPSGAGRSPRPLARPPAQVRRDLRRGQAGADPVQADRHPPHGTGAAYTVQGADRRQVVPVSPAWCRPQRHRKIEALPKA